VSSETTPLATLPEPAVTDWRAIDWDAHVHTADVVGAQLTYADIGQGDPPVLFIHGLGAQWRVWLANLPVVAAHRRAVAVDLPGFGGPSMPAGRISIRGYAEVLDRFCEQIGAERVVVVGNSMGGFVAAELALIRPERVERLVLVDAAGIVPTRSERLHALPFLRAFAILGARVAAASRAIAARPRGRGAALKLIVHDPDHLPPDLTYHALLAPPGPAASDALAASLSYLSHEWGDRLSAIRCPTLIIWGEGDALIPVRHAHEYARRIPHARVVIFPATGHIPMVEQPERFNATLLEFIGASGDERSA
jgi:pimeloyl-ACP methyl ester carboxylesterase